MVSEPFPHTVLLTWRWPTQTLDTVTWNSETPACPSLLSVTLGPHSVIRGVGSHGLGLNFPAFCLFPSACQKQGE